MVDGGSTDMKVVVVRDHEGMPELLLSDLAELLPQLESLDEEEEEEERQAEQAGGQQQEQQQQQQQQQKAAGWAASSSSGSRASILSLASSGSSSSSSQQRLQRLQSAPSSLPSQQLAAALQPLSAGPAALQSAHLAAELEAVLREASRGGQGRLSSASPAAAALGPGGSMAAAPLALPLALQRLSAGQQLAAEEAAVLRHSLRVWAAARLAHLRDWLATYKSAAGSSSGSTALEWGGAFLDASAARSVVLQMHEAWQRLKRPAQGQAAA
jgi:DNA mismatch repair ATPase MutL